MVRGGAFATSPNEYEASAAAAKAQEILTEHNLRLENMKTVDKSPEIEIEQILFTLLFNSSSLRQPSNRSRSIYN